ncbi:MAG: hypothetical protein B6D45_04715 [Ignavibacteriales bacterium UTCHB3]|nr:MAG: hypothetical protein B6D45_04715 [Ignavibacteriales bacterium UTCHB3]
MIDKLKQLSKETVIYGISTVVGRFLNFVLVPFYSNIFAPDEMGVVANLYAYMAIFNIVFIYGMDSALLKVSTLPEYRGTKKVFTTSYITVFTTGAVFSLILYLLMPYLGVSISVNPEFAAKYQHLISYSINILFLDALSVLPFIVLRLENKAFTFSMIRLINIVINIGLNFVLILIFKMKIEAVFFANLIASAFSFLALLPITYSNLSFEFDFGVLKRLMKFGLPFLPAGLAAMVMQVVDKPIVERLTNIEKLGIYNANYKLGVFMMLFVSMFQFAWQPFFLQHADDDDARDLFAKVFTYFTIVGSFILVFLTIFIEDITSLGVGRIHFLGEAFWSGRNIIPVILLGYLFYGFYVNFNASFYIKEKSIPVPILLGIGAISNIVLNYLLVPQFELMGAAFATLISYMLIAIGFFYYGRRLFEINYEYRKVGTLLLLIGVVFVIYYTLIDGANVSLFVKILFAAAYPAALVLLRVVTPREVTVIKSTILRKVRGR